MSEASGTHSNHPLSCPCRRIVADIREKVVKWGRRNAVARRFHASDNKETITAWRLDLDKILWVFDVRHFTRMKIVAHVLVAEGIPNKHDRNRPYRS